MRLLRWARRPQSIERWLDGLEVVEVQTIDQEDRCCAICHEDLADKAAVDTEPRADEVFVIEEDDVLDPEHPLRVAPCNHIFGNRCLKTWLSPGPEGVNSNTCPICRQVIFDRHDEEDEEGWEGQGWPTVHRGFS